MGRRWGGGKKVGGRVHERGGDVARVGRRGEEKGRGGGGGGGGWSRVRPWGGGEEGGGG